MAMINDFTWGTPESLSICFIIKKLLTPPFLQLQAAR
jgi:hypothetical protein